jgi:hypothetical protein
VSGCKREREREIVCIDIYMRVWNSEEISKQSRTNNTGRLRRKIITFNSKIKKRDRH